ncbi:MAG: DUF4381 domain-containing protein [Magnetococcales bacterium]|nr:DUF4381 domain-containing protein [Magnetococcales bacterium]
MDNTAPDLDLRDIHLPDPLSWWPPAPGWWMVLGLVATVALLGGLFRWHQKKHRLRKAALAELDRLVADYEIHQDSHRLTGDLSALLRRVCLSSPFAGLSVTRPPGLAGLSGMAWLHFLEHDWAAGHPFTQGVGRWLMEQPFRPPSATQPSLPPEEVTALIALCRTWLQIHTLPRRRLRSSS